MDKQTQPAPLKESARKRLMFVTQDDFYFLTYCILLTLSTLKCFDEKQSFRDVRKLAFVVEFISDGHLADTLRALLSESKVFRQSDKEALAGAYTKGRDRLPFVNRLIYALEAKGLLKIYPDQESKVLNVSLERDKLPEGFANNDVFDSELRNLGLLKEALSRIRTVGLDTFLENTFRRNGVATWLD